jgi:hypothetical protein
MKLQESFEHGTEQHMQASALLLQNLVRTIRLMPSLHHEMLRHKFTHIACTNVIQPFRVSAPEVPIKEN